MKIFIHELYLKKVRCHTLSMHGNCLNELCKVVDHGEDVLGALVLGW